MADRVLSKEHIKKRQEIAAVLAKSAPKGKRGFGSAVDRLAIDVLYELIVTCDKAQAAKTLYISLKPHG